MVTLTILDTLQMLQHSHLHHSQYSDSHHSVCLGSHHFIQVVTTNLNNLLLICYDKLNLKFKLL
jgi:hypothetical protein